jgi:cellulose synthase/poly-beta-1,6-N-acetylglucosamine synthase-like glycosyltransferase
MTLVLPKPDGPVSALAEPPSFSIVIPVYQGAWCVADAVASVLDQRTPAHEVLVCDDGSTDDLAGALAPFAGRVTILHQRHAGVAAARNLGLTHATGDFVAICDADDLFLPGLLEAWTTLATSRPDLDILGRASYVERDGTVVGVSRTPEDPPFDIEDQRRSILAVDFIGGCSAFRRQRLVDLGGYDESLPCAEDYDSFLRLVLSGCRAGLNFEPLAVVRVRPDSLSRNELCNLRGLVATFTTVLDRDDLSAGERRLARERLDRFRADLEREEAKVAVEDGRPDARRRCLAVARSGAQAPVSRLKAGATALSPALARWTRRTQRTLRGRRR